MPVTNITPLYNFEIGTTVAGMANIELFGIPPPYQEKYVPNGVRVDAADGRIYGHGWPRLALRWGYIHQDHRDVLKGYCPGASSEVYIRVLAEDNTWDYCKAVMIWPESESPANNGYIFDLVIAFRVLENYGASLP